MANILQDVHRPSEKKRQLILQLVGVGAAVAVGLLIPISLATVFSDRITLMLAAIGGFILLLVSMRVPVTLVYAIILYESLLSWHDTSQIQLLGYNRL